MNKFFISLATALTFLSCSDIFAQGSGYDVFVPISKYIGKGDAESLSAWFSDNLEVTIFSNSNDSSRSQATQIIKSFFTHKAGRSNMKYALGTLNAGGENFLVTIFVGYYESGYRIQHIKIERSE